MFFRKDPQDKLDYGVDFTDWLDEGDTALAATWTVPLGITRVSDQLDGAIATVWLEGGTHGIDYDCTCHLTTSAGRAKEHTIRIMVREQ